MGRVTRKAKIYYIAREGDRVVDGIYISCMNGCEKGEICKQDVVNLILTGRGYRIRTEENEVLYELERYTRGEKHMKGYIESLYTSNPVKCPMGFQELRPVKKIKESNKFLPADRKHRVYELLFEIC